MKRKLYILAIAVFLLLCAGCGKQDTPVTSETPTAPSLTPTETTEAPTTEAPPTTMPPVETQPAVTVAAAFTYEEEAYYAPDDAVLFREKFPYMSLYAKENPHISAIVNDFGTRVTGPMLDEIIDSGLGMAIENYDPDGYWEPYYLEQTYETTRIDARVFSIAGKVETYFGGVHPNHTLTSVTYDLETGKVLSLPDILVSADCLPTLAEMVLSTLAGQGEGSLLFDDYITVVMAHFDLNNALIDSWYFNDNGLVLYFSVYEISSYAAGDFVLEYSYRDLAGILKEEFLPEDVNDAHGELTAALCEGVITDSDNLITSIYLVNDGPMVILSADGEIRNVCIESGVWANGGSMFIVENSLFSCNRLDKDAEVLVQTFLQEMYPNLRISYTTAEGEFSRYLAINYGTGELKLLSGAK